ncbi:uncharacterized protein LOC122638905 [Telopea speciosissima]|uniref:uncharacterized protein LOC122638905 n=1 Tax=Telopea speciosissima TaxID=54955 RepID=UPI001CC3C4F6|nr:uncharacterized protein LOC122638905 [Telopea speciosissima]
MVDSCDLLKVSSQGNKLTWSNNRKSGHVNAVLDKAFCNAKWMEYFNSCSQLVLHRVASDHSPVFLALVGSKKPKNAPFCFHKFWMEDQGFLEVVKNSWSQLVRGSPFFILNQKLKRLKLILRSWAREVFHNFDVALKDAKAALEDVQEAMEVISMNDSMFGLEANAKTNFLCSLRNSEKLWQEKSRNEWLKENPAGLSNHVVDFFKNFHKVVPLEEHLDLLDVIPSSLEAADVVKLDTIPSLEEIRRVIGDLDPDSTPGPDDFNGAFYRWNWDIIEPDVCKAISNFFRESIIPKCVWAMQGFLDKYQNFLGQKINLEKSKLFCGSISPSRSRRISDLLKVPLCSLPTNYQGVEIFRGRVTKDKVMPLVDKFKKRLSGWKGKLLSLVGRVELERSVMLSVPVHNFSIYWWPSSCISIMEKWIRNFIWSGDIETKKAVTVKWDLANPIANHLARAAASSGDSLLVVSDFVSVVNAFLLEDALRRSRFRFE